jgi:hypothetical protein
MSCLNDTEALLQCFHIVIVDERLNRGSDSFHLILNLFLIRRLGIQHCESLKRLERRIQVSKKYTCFSELLCGAINFIEAVGYFDDKVDGREDVAN